jgi:hypothetical protein
VWQPGPDLASIHVETGITDIDPATSRELLAHLNPIDGSVVRLTAITRTDGCRMVLAAHHAALDGAASVELIDHLRRFYLARCAGQPEPSTSGSPRTIAAALQQRRLSVAFVQGLLTQSLDRWRKLPPSNHVDPPPGADLAASGYLTIDLGPTLQ